jgi:hypothetical protein
MSPISNAEAQARWRAKNNAYATLARSQLTVSAPSPAASQLTVSAPSPAAKSKRAKLEAEQVRLSELWCRQLGLLADARNYFGRLKSAPMSEWASNERAEVLSRMRAHESTASALNTLLKSNERELKTFEKHEETLATSRRHLRGRR